MKHKSTSPKGLQNSGSDTKTLNVLSQCRHLSAASQTSLESRIAYDKLCQKKYQQTKILITVTKQFEHKFKPGKIKLLKKSFYTEQQD
jgi:hypothetical protein